MLRRLQPLRLPMLPAQSIIRGQRHIHSNHDPPEPCPVAPSPSPSPPPPPPRLPRRQPHSRSKPRPPKPFDKWRATVMNLEKHGAPSSSSSSSSASAAEPETETGKGLYTHLDGDVDVDVDGDLEERRSVELGRKKATKQAAENRIYQRLMTSIRMSTSTSTSTSAGGMGPPAKAAEVEADVDKPKPAPATTDEEDANDVRVFARRVFRKALRTKLDDKHKYKGKSTARYDYVPNGVVKRIIRDGMAQGFPYNSRGEGVEADAEVKGNE